MIRLSTLFLIALSFAHASTFIIHLDNSTSLDDGNLFTSGTTYYSAFQLTGGDSSSSMATISDIELGDGAPIAPSNNDPTSGIYLVAPNPAAPDGIFQPSGTLNQSITPVSAYSLYTQQFVAGSDFQFTVSLAGTYAGGIPDSFSFQLYDAGLDTLLYEQDFDVLNGPGSQAVATSEPTSVVFYLLGGLLIVQRLLKRRISYRCRF